MDNDTRATRTLKALKEYRKREPHAELAKAKAVIAIYEKALMDIRDGNTISYHEGDSLVETSYDLDIINKALQDAQIHFNEEAKA